MDTPKRLRPGRQGLSRDDVRDHQRERIFGALETVMSAKGYLDTSVADLIRAAGVSRQTFYELFDSKQGLFLAAWARRQRRMLTHLPEVAPSATRIDRFDRFLDTYLATMAADTALARLFLIGIFAAGPEAIARRLDMQQQFVALLTSLLEADTDEDRFACRTLVAAIASLVTSAVIADDAQAVRDLHGPLVAMTRRLFPDG
jgi:TetR/AcrR family transcriptional regulator